MEKQTYFRNMMTEDVVSRESKDRTMTFVISDEKVNRYGHKVMVEGWDLKAFKANNVVLYNHNADLPIANAVRVWKNKDSKQLLAKIKFHPEGMSPLSDFMFNLYDNDLLKATSPGYLVDRDKAEYGKKDKDPAVTFNGQELCEISLCTVPAGRGALKQQSYIQNALELGVIDEAFLDDELLGVYEEDAEEQTEDVENNDQPDEETVTNHKEDVVEVEKDYMDISVQKDTIDESNDPYADFYIAFDEINQEQKDSKDPEKLAGKVIESIEGEDSNDTANDDLDSCLEQVLNTK